MSCCYIHVCHVFVVVHVQYYPMSYHKQSLTVKTVLDSTLKGGCHSLMSLHVYSAQVCPHTNNHMPKTT